MIRFCVYYKTNNFASIHHFTFRKIFFFFSNLKQYDRGDSFLYDFQTNGIPFGLKPKGKLSPRSYPIQYKTNWKYSFLSVCETKYMISLSNRSGFLGRKLRRIQGERWQVLQGWWLWSGGCGWAWWGGHHGACPRSTNPHWRPPILWRRFPHHYPPWSLREHNWKTFIWKNLQQFKLFYLKSIHSNGICFYSILIPNNRIYFISYYQYSTLD